MEQPWIHKAKTDIAFILAPSFLVVAFVILCQGWIHDIEKNYPFHIWLFLIVFIDVAHVYATLFKTYFVKEEFNKKKKLLLFIPLLCLCIGCILFALGSKLFWSVLAYVAVFHFVRQQYGFMRLYARNESKSKANTFIDNLVIYSATGYPMLYWFLSGSRNFNWFVENEFFIYHNQFLLEVAHWLYALVMGFYVVRTAYLSYKTRYFNLPKNAVIIGTAISWYFGIVYYNNDLIFTLLNVVSHGIPYMALIYLKEIDKKTTRELGVLSYLKNFKGIIIYVSLLFLIAFFEEYLWEILVWKEQFMIGVVDFSNWQFLVVPLLTVPQFTHYLLDGFIWKSK
jgi:hypothetical protein